MSGATFEGTLKTCDHGTLAGSFCAKCQTDAVIRLEQETREALAEESQLPAVNLAEVDDAIRALLRAMAARAEELAAREDVPIEMTVSEFQEGIRGLRRAQSFVSVSFLRSGLEPSEG